MKNKLQQSWYIYVDNEQYGPCSYEKIKSFIQDGLVSHNDYIWDEEKKNWILFKDFEIFNKINKSDNNTLENKLQIPDILKLKGTKIYYGKFRKGEANRFYRRLNLNLPAEISLENNTKTYSIHLNDISIGGLSGEGPNLEGFNENDEVFANIFISHLNRYLSIKGILLRKNKIVSNHYKISIKFTDISKEDGKLLVEILSWNCKTFY